MLPVRCNTCGRAGLPVFPGTAPNAGPAHPVAHAAITGFTDDVPTIAPCFQGSRLAVIEAHGLHLERVMEVKRSIADDGALWELDA